MGRLTLRRHAGAGAHPAVPTLRTACGVPVGGQIRPPSVNRVIGLRWLGHVLYPEAFPGSVRDETRNFYGLFYHRVPDERQLDSLLGARS